MSIVTVGVRAAVDDSDTKSVRAELVAVASGMISHSPKVADSGSSDSADEKQGATTRRPAKSLEDLLLRCKGTVEFLKKQPYFKGTADGWLRRSLDKNERIKIVFLSEKAATFITCLHAAVREGLLGGFYGNIDGIYPIGADMNVKQGGKHVRSGLILCEPTERDLELREGATTVEVFSYEKIYDEYRRIVREISEGWQSVDPKRCSEGDGPLIMKDEDWLFLARSPRSGVGLFQLEQSCYRRE